MLKLNASYSKKVPAEGEYSSQSYHASIEVELPDGLTQEQLNGKIHETFALVRESVEAELHGAAPAVPSTQEQTAEEPRAYEHRAPQRDNGYARHRSGTQDPASPKQINYLLSLASRRGISPQQVACQFNVTALEDLTKRQVSGLIEQWRG